MNDDMTYIILACDNQPGRVWKRVREIEREPGGVKLFLDDHSQIILPNKTLVEINASPSSPLKKPKRRKRAKASKAT